VTDVERLGEALFVRVARLHRLISSEVGAGPSVAQSRTLARLAAGGPMRVSALAVTERMAQPSMTAMVDRMVRTGWVERGSDPSDGRAVTVTITGLGQVELDRVRVVSGQALDARLAPLGAAERAALVAALPALDALLADPTPPEPADPTPPEPTPSDPAAADQETN
jgi:DNA-binding MarR family transcriptional regulator